jgi:hypothetical protein
MRNRIFFLSLALVAASPGAAAPEPKGEPVTPTGTRIPRWEMPVVASTAKAVRTLHTYSACLVSKVKDPSALLRTPPESAEQAAVVRKLTGKSRGCYFDGQLRFQAYLFRGAMAEALFRAKLPPLGEGPAPAPPPDSFEQFSARLIAGSRRPIDEEGRQIVMGRWLGYCSAYENPGGIAAVLQAEPSTPSEIAALRAMRPTLEGCLFRGTTASMDAIAVRALLAEALYQRHLPLTAA